MFTTQNLQYFTSKFYDKIKNTFLSKEDGVKGVILGQDWELVNSVVANNPITLPSIDTFEEIYIETQSNDATIVHQVSLNKDSLLFESTNTTHREILIDSLLDVQTYVTYSIADNTITLSSYEGTDVDNTSTTITTKVYVKKMSEVNGTIPSSRVTYDDTTTQLGANSLQNAIEKVDNKIDGIEQTATNTSYINSTSGLSATNVQGAIDENASIGNQALAIANGRNQALAYTDYSEMVTALNSMGVDELKRGQNLYIGTVGVPDLWVYSVEANNVAYTYVDDDTIVNTLDTNTTIQVGYYKLAQLETQKVDLTNIESEIDALQTSDTDITNRITELENANSGNNEILHYLGELKTNDTALYQFLCNNTVNLKIILTGYDGYGTPIRNYFNSVKIKIDTSKLNDGVYNNFIYSINSTVSSNLKLSIDYSINYSRAGNSLTIKLNSITGKSGTSSWNVYVSPFIYVIL